MEKPCVINNGKIMVQIDSISEAAEKLKEIKNMLGEMNSNTVEQQKLLEWSQHFRDLSNRLTTLLGRNWCSERGTSPYTYES